MFLCILAMFLCIAAMITIYLEVRYLGKVDKMDGKVCMVDAIGGDDMRDYMCNFYHIKV